MTSRRTRTKTGRNIVWMRRFSKETFKKSSTSNHSSLQRADVKDEGKEFLRSQREDRGESSMAGIDLVTAKKVEKQVERGTRLKRLRNLPLKFLEWTLGVWRSRRARSIEHELRGESKPPRRSWNCGTRRYLRGWSCIGTENSSRPSLAIRRTTSPSSSQGKDDAELFLGVPASSDSTGRNVAAVVLKEVDEAGVRNKIIAFCFDTTASNTDMVQGACIRIEQELGRSLLWLACRHHVNEVILKDVFEASLGSSSGPDIGIFKRLRDRWSFVDSSQRETVETSEDLVEFFATNDTASKLKDDALAFLKEALMSKNHPREDYEELLRLSYLFLGGEGPAKPFRRPGALHKARWMAKAIYCLKLQMLKSQLSLTAPLNEVLFLEILKTYPDQTVAKAAEQALRRHLWYVSKENTGLAFFDSRIDVEEKKQMVKALDKPA
ncbi:hypothetical protein GWK47_036965 [Chionoecetes opilio]|uniref:Cc8K15.2-like protein n=1 Tax=Chionoecetes opilio TaxID=41210 RepID=A0A8J4YFC5_CHIOP|nr:hypothetical protein GWK47_036965 [Chionoecetes opilio]